MDILQHRLIPTDVSELVSYRADLDSSGALEHPSVAVIHFAVTTSAEATEQVLRAREYVSCHVCIDSNRVIQMVPFDKVAFHAGPSLYKGRTRVNSFSLGIEMANPGPLVKAADGSFKTTYGAKWDGEVYEGKHKNGACPYRFWAAFENDALERCAQVVDLWRENYGITAVVGHDDVSPGRKIDPGPAFPMVWLRDVTGLT